MQKHTFTFRETKDMTNKKFVLTFEEKEGRVSFTGEYSEDGRWHSCGQNVDMLRTFESKAAQRLAVLWDRWHLNDMRPYCEHQKKLGWDTVASEKVTLYHWRLTPAALAAKKDSEERALDSLRAGKTHRPTQEERDMASLSWDKTTSTKRRPSSHYAPSVSLYSSDPGHEETKMLGWLTPKQHPRGILSKPCPTCGYKYGTEWKREEVPKRILVEIQNIHSSTSN